MIEEGLSAKYQEIEYKVLLIKNFPDEVDLNTLGSMGWKMTCVVQDNVNRKVVVYFQRQVFR